MGQDSGATVYAAGLRTASNSVLTLSEDDATFADDVTVQGDVTVNGTFHAVGLGTASDTVLTLSENDATFADDVTVQGDVTIASDIRLKANIASLGATLAKLLLIDGKTYTLKKDGKQKIGLLAQNIQEVFPELVSKDDNEMLAVNYQGLVPVLINALKEQNVEIKKQDIKTKEQDAKISRLEGLVEKLMANK
jgi:superfamily I DNA and RNA helicase